MADYVTIISDYVTIILNISDICIMLIMSMFFEFSLYPPIDVHELPRCASISTHLEKHVLEQLTILYWHVQ